MKVVLIVEDQSDIRKLVRMTLECNDLEIHEAGDGGYAYKMACAVKPDLILLDVMMPGELDGYQVCRKVKSNPSLANTRVVMLTARGQARDRQAGNDAGADDYLIKPFSPLELIDTVERLTA